jgi:hypothetical protein
MYVTKDTHLPPPPPPTQPPPVATVDVKWPVKYSNFTLPQRNANCDSAAPFLNSFLGQNRQKGNYLSSIPGANNKDPIFFNIDFTKQNQDPLCR